MDLTAVRSRAWPHILSEDLQAVPEPLVLLVRPGPVAVPDAVARLAARALVHSAGDDDRSPPGLPAWLAAHQIPAARRILSTLERYGGALLADAVGLGKSYVALAVALARREPFALVVPAVLEDQWRALLALKHADAPLITHEALSAHTIPPGALPQVRLFIVDEAHRFRNRETRRYRELAKLVTRARVLLVTATPVHNRMADLFRLFHLFLRDDALTGLGVRSLHCAARGLAPLDGLPAAAARLAVARTRRWVQAHYAREERTAAPALVFPARGPGSTLRAGPLPDAQLGRLCARVGRLHGPGSAGALFRLLLLTRLGSSVPAFRESLSRYEAFLELAGAAARDGRALGAREFGRLFPDRDAAVEQLPLFPMLLEPGAIDVHAGDLAIIAELRDGLADFADPKAVLLERLLSEGCGKTIVFTTARATARYLARRLSSVRVATVLGDRGLLGWARVARAEVLRAFAPRAQQAPSPPPALETDVLIATDLLSEGVNLQDAARVIHYDLPWSPARLAQRVGRIDRLGSLHGSVETVSFLPPRAIADALHLEERLARKGREQAVAAAELESVRGREAADGLDWCDRLDVIGCARGPSAAAGAWATIPAEARESAVLLVVRLGALVEAIVVDEKGARPDPIAATRWLERATTASLLPANASMLERAIERAAPLVRGRLAAIADARWRAADRDRLGRRLIPWVLAAARKAARRGDSTGLARLDALVSRLAAGMTAGEEFLLDELVERRAPLTVEDLLAWDARLSPVGHGVERPEAELVAALVVVEQ
ncbi:MAG TPA: DEAD/DEAH box helicase [Gemmatimonadales bacterium]|nr:DEAD/DEAH box helicase [Gemmatimonadales bacterium]